MYAVYSSSSIVVVVVVVTISTSRQADSLLERLVTRLGMSTSTRQRRYLSFCISQLNITDKGVKKMIELFKYV